MIKRAWRKWGPNPFERILKRAARKQQRRVLIAWNRGLGDVALGLYALVFRIRELIPDAEITFVTRPDLKEGFALLKEVEVLTTPTWKRGAAYNIKATLADLGKDFSTYDLILEKPDPTHWVRWQLGTLTPQLLWQKEWDTLWQNFPLRDAAVYIALQPQTETGSNYGYEKNWPLTYWKELIARLSVKEGVRVILFGREQTLDFPENNVIDLRGKTSLLEMLSIIKNRCKHLIVPDSGVLSLTYFLDADFPLEITSLWADPKQGVLKQNVPSPNTQLVHRPLIAEDGDLRRLTLSQVWEAACSKI